MSSSKAKLSASPETDYFFLAKWSERKLPTYIDEYGGQRAGVPKGEDIPFPPHKVKAAVALLAYGAPKYETLTAIARTVGVSSALLRVWRTEARFLALYHRAVWECADDYIRTLAVDWNVDLPSPFEEFLETFGFALQQAILRRLCVDVTHMVPEWVPIGLAPKWLSECVLVGPPSKASPLFSDVETKFLKTNTRILLSYNLVRRGIRDPSLANWTQRTLLRQWAVNITLNNMIAVLEKGMNVDVLSLLKSITANNTPIDDLERFHREMSRKSKARKKR